MCLRLKFTGFEHNLKSQLWYRTFEWLACRWQVQSPILYRNVHICIISSTICRVWAAAGCAGNKDQEFPDGVKTQTLFPVFCFFTSHLSTRKSFSCADTSSLHIYIFFLLYYWIYFFKDFSKLLIYFVCITKEISAKSAVFGRWRQTVKSCRGQTSWVQNLLHLDI